MNHTKLYEVLQDCYESAPHFFASGFGHHVRVDVNYFTSARFSSHCDNAEGLYALLSTLLAAYRSEHTTMHPTSVKVSWVYADDN